jgi:polyisoprenoid-binding protein YceI
MLASAVLAVTLTGSVLAQTPPTAKTVSPETAAPKVAPQAPTPGTYKVEPSHTEIMFGVNHLGFTMYYGVFSGASGTLVLDTADLSASRLDVSVPVSSVLTPSSRLNRELQGPQWLDADTYPDMTFRSKHITLTGRETARVEGEITLHGVTRPLTLEAKFNHAGENPLDHRYTVGFQARGVLKRSDFGVKAYMPLVGDDVHLNISAAFERAPNSP